MLSLRSHGVPLAEWQVAKKTKAVAAAQLHDERSLIEDVASTVVIERAILQLHAIEEQALLLRRDALLLLDLRFDLADRVAAERKNRDRLVRERLDDDLLDLLSEDRGLLVDVVVQQRVVILQLLAVEPPALDGWSAGKATGWTTTHTIFALTLLIVSSSQTSSVAQSLSGKGRSSQSAIT